MKLYKYYIHLDQKLLLDYCGLNILCISQCFVTRTVVKSE